MQYCFYEHDFLHEGDRLAIAGDSRIVQHIQLHHKDTPIPQVWQHCPDYMMPLRKRLDGYFQGGMLEHSIPAITHGTALQQAVWRVIAGIARGQTISYSELAQRAGFPRAIRAVATACGRNPLPILIPCHRVRAQNGSIGGFAWGLAYKEKLLALEGLHLK